ncbi:MAG: hypothetical protein KA717_37985 [Woronichinia naegeliana WA131]|uniref:Uncharacterized protein n=1 Tax=Woronichinia naegeliana WA131 TaxID=2824559 RepID=A0A977KWE1_9CYAN|nr:MAG: hypothetical protein KA717_37985 [Woronichinia naegeliana WA131]
MRSQFIKLRCDRGSLSQTGKKAIAVYSLKLEKRRSRFIVSNWKKGDRSLFL